MQRCVCARNATNDLYEVCLCVCVVDNTFRELRCLVQCVHFGVEWLCVRRDLNRGEGEVVMHVESAYVVGNACFACYVAVYNVFIWVCM